ncbi:hypothetical protein OsJ_36112 [Oryza sativa Japonica Group]|uniref:Uncharacterized protein n=2 Tax=Oryza sativa subsp. japonica TaxID=39947 RepID=A0A8J8YB58_ORYSJ|nr:hypothetical protein LOC_Os12g30130 [Oryza sativa Japonica Group]EAZ20506.1 hypothetical protein OsJ_36112 [Oryza sativa Japonica Group]
MADEPMTITDHAVDAEGIVKRNQSAMRMRGINMGHENERYPGSRSEALDATLIEDD